MSDGLTVAVALLHAQARMPAHAYANDAAFDLTATVRPSLIRPPRHARRSPTTMPCAVLSWTMSAATPRRRAITPALA
jgi:hypothetical protein